MQDIQIEMPFEKEILSILSEKFLNILEFESE